MMDPALERLCDALPDYSGRLLLVADEHLDSKLLLSLKTIENLSLLTNRYDVYQAAMDSNLSCQYNDMDLRQLGGRFDLIAYRVSKEKAIVHHIINQVPEHLNANGRFLLCGYKNEGIKTYISKAEHYLGSKAEVSKGERQLKLAELSCQTLGEALDDRNYLATVSIGERRNLELFSKPGQFGWNKIDKGSELLIDAFAEHVQQTQAPGSVLDLGCGYGYLGIMAWALGAKQVVATDNNAAAIQSCQDNFTRHGINGEVIADDCAAGIHHQYDVVLCNPPFHKGFDTERDLTEKFIRSARHHLKNDGVAFVVVNQFIAVETIAPAYFKSVENLHRDKSFKVFKLSS
ncbi:class I SAM-dependent methyltransferase [Ketobacter sp.]|uniref:class I SAM-dependent methyltransferase n=1 Tax=Ketobacter sp. TaxID=2083498 RepID=UPI000F1EAEB5|nr:methyltransferase [Ketobacter sp.]RLT92093.1 MAG: class I SAM-dependent methyltransferase [Ketobacter sp.]